MRRWFVAAAIAAVLVGDVVAVATHGSSAAASSTSPLPTHLSHVVWQRGLPDGIPQVVVAGAGVAVGFRPLDVATGPSTSWLDAFDPATGSTRWTATVPGTIDTAAVVGSTLWVRLGFYATDDSEGYGLGEAVVAVDLATGRTLATHPYASVVSVVPDGTGGVLVEAGDFGGPHVHDLAATGEERWDGGTVDSNLVADPSSHRYLAALHGDLLVGDLATGARVAVAVPQGASSSTRDVGVQVSSVRGGVAYVDDGGKLSEVSLADRKVLRTIDIPAERYVVRRSSDTLELFDLGRGGTAGVDLRTGRQLWAAGRYPLRAGTTAVAVLYDKASVQGVDLRTGRARWTETACHDLIAGDGHVVVTTCDVGGRTVLEGIDAGSGRRLWRVPLQGGTSLSPTAVAASGSLLLVADGSGVQALR